MMPTPSAQECQPDDQPRGRLSDFSPHHTGNRCVWWAFFGGVCRTITIHQFLLDISRSFVCLLCHDLLARVFVKIGSHITIAVKARIQTNNKRPRCQRTWQLPEALKRARLFSRNPNCLQTNDWTGNSYYPNQDIYIYKDVYLLGKHAARSDW